jgi:hypothetical protein
MFKSFTSNENKPAAKGKPKGTTTPADDAPIPKPVRLAGKLALGGAAGSVVWGVYWAILALAFKGQDARYVVNTQHVTLSKANTEVYASMLLVLVQALLYAGLWVWIGRMNTFGRNWARITSTVFFLLWTYETYRAISGLSTYIALGNLLIMLAIWGFGAGALYFLWRPDSTVYFKATSQRP